MSTIATQTTSLVSVRAAGSKNLAGEQFGGVYYPPHVKNGLAVSGRWEGNVALNGKPYTDSQGQPKKAQTIYLRMVVWNSKNSEAGKGLADTFAKCVSVGKELSCNVRIESFEKRLFINGQAILDQQGNAITHPAINFVLEDKLIFGPDSNKVITLEINNYVGNATFNSRPRFWNVPEHADQVAWSKVIVPARMASVWDGVSERFGYARVIVPEGAVAGNPQMPAQNAANGNAQAPAQGESPTAAAAHLAMPAGQPGPAPMSSADTPL